MRKGRDQSYRLTWGACEVIMRYTPPGRSTRDTSPSIRAASSAAASPHKRASRVPLSRMPGCSVCGGGRVRGVSDVYSLLQPPRTGERSECPCPGCLDALCVCGGGAGQHHAHILKGILEIFKDTFAQDG